MTQRVFDYCAKSGATALQGDRSNRPFFRHSDGKERFYSPKRKVRVSGSFSNTAETFYFSNLSCKDKLVELWRAGIDYWALPSDVPSDYVKQLGAEFRSIVNGKPIWLTRGARANHYWDCETMQIVAALLVKII